jgi:general stress protein 26
MRRMNKSGALEMSVEKFSDIEEEFMRRVAKTVWCSVATVDTRGRTRSRILHPIWEGSVGWIATGRDSLKAKHIEANSYVSLTYWDPDHEQVIADCTAEWIDDQSEKERLWELFKSTPPPLGYDLAAFFQAVDNPGYGLMKLTPWRVELWSLKRLAVGEPPEVWKPLSQ